MNVLKQPKHLISISLVPFEDITGDGVFFFRDFKAPVDKGDELVLLLLNTLVEFVGDVGSLEVDNKDFGSGEDRKVCFIVDDVGEVW